jgi:hypothetical protein
VAVVLAASATIVLLAACGGGDGSSEMRLTLTDDDCTYQGDKTPPATQTFEAELENQSSKLGAFEIARIDAGHSFAEVEAYVKEQKRRLEEGLEIVRPPAYMTLGARAVVPSGESGMLVSTVTSGQWVLWCAHDDPPTAVFLITRSLEVSE